MKYILITIMTVLAVALSGCSILTPEQPQERIVYKAIRVPSEMTQKVVVTKPPEPVFYSALPWDQQEALLMGLVQDHTKSLGVCNARLYGVDSWSDKQLQLYEPTNP